MTNNAGQFLLNSGQGDLDLRISMDGYDDWASTVSGNTTLLLVSLNRRTLNLNVALYDSNSLQSVSGATLYLTSANSTQVKTSDASGAASFGVTAYTYYTLNITASNYQPRSETIDVSNKDQNVQYWLLSGTVSFVVKDKNSLAAVADASISVNSVLLGKTDSRGILIAPISRDTPVTIEVQKTGYQMVTQVKTISTNRAVDAVLLADQSAPLSLCMIKRTSQSTVQTSMLTIPSRELQIHTAVPRSRTLFPAIIYSW